MSQFRLDRRHLKAAQFIHLFLFLLGFSACSSMEVSSEKSPGVDLTHYKSYSWAPRQAGQASQDQVLDQNIRNSMDESLQKNGFRKATNEVKPDFLVRYTVTSHEKVEEIPGSVGMGYPVGPYWGGYTAIPPSIESYEEGSLVVDFIDAHSKVPFWRGVATAEIDSQTDETSELDQAARKIVGKYREAESQQLKKRQA